MMIMHKMFSTTVSQNWALVMVKHFQKQPGKSILRRLFHMRVLKISSITLSLSHDVLGTAM